MALAAESEKLGNEEMGKHKIINSNLLPGFANMLINGVSSDGLRRWAMCSLRPAGPGTPPG